MPRPKPDRDGAPLLGTGFALRLARNLAVELHGSLVIGDKALTLRLPAAVIASVEQVLPADRGPIHLFRMRGAGVPRPAARRRRSDRLAGGFRHTLHDLRRYRGGVRLGCAARAGQAWPVARTAIPEAHRRFADRGVPLTFWSTIRSRPIAAIDMLRARWRMACRRSGRSSTPGSIRRSTSADASQQLCRQFAAALEAAKLDALTDAITTAFGAAPRAYRAGRYGIGPATFGLLAAGAMRSIARCAPPIAMATKAARISRDRQSTPFAPGRRSSNCR